MTMGIAGGSRNVLAGRAEPHAKIGRGESDHQLVVGKLGDRRAQVNLNQARQVDHQADGAVEVVRGDWVLTAR